MASEFHELFEVIEKMHINKKIETYKKLLYTKDPKFDFAQFIHLNKIWFKNDPATLTALLEVEKEYTLLKLISQ